MAESLDVIDFVVIGVYFLAVLGVGIWSTFRPNRGHATGYFLAGKSMHWIPVGASIYASNIGAPMFIGLAGTAAASGLAVTIYEWIAVYFLVALGWIFLPVYISCGVFTMPEYLRKRFGGKRIRMFSSIFALIGFILFNISIEIYSGAIFLQHILGWNMYLCVVIILSVTALFTVVGGLAAVIYTDTLQSIVLVISGTILAIMGLIEVGGWDGMTEKYMNSYVNRSLLNDSYKQCGLPRKDSLHIIRHPIQGDIPWTGAFTGLSFLGLYVWSQDQLIVQRTLSAKNMAHAKAGTLFGCVLKLTGLLLFIIPGMISRILYPDEIACADPESCNVFCNNKSGCSNFAYPLLVIRLLPQGLRGLMLAALLAALMSSMTSILNSASSIMTMDVWRQFRKYASQSELMIVGRLTVLVLVVISVLWLPILKSAEGGIFWFYMQAIRSYLIPPMCVMFVLGVFWKGLTEQGAFWGLVVGFTIGIIRMSLDFSFPAPPCGTEQTDKRPEIIDRVDFLHFAAILGIVTTLVMVAISLFTTKRPPKKLRRVTWWTRNDYDEPDLSSEEENNDDDEEEKPGQVFHMENITQDTAKNEIMVKFKNWVCGSISEPEKKLSPEERLVLRRKMTSLEENRKHNIILNVSAVAIMVITTVLIGIFH